MTAVSPGNRCGCARPAVLLFLVLLPCLLLSFCSAARVPRRPPPSRYTVDYAFYHNYSRYLSEIHRLAADPLLAPYLSLHTHSARTHLNQSLHLLSLSSPSPPIAPGTSSSQEKLLFLLSFGEHPRELVSVESLFDLVHSLLSPLAAAASSPAACLSAEHQLSSFLLSHVSLHLLPLLNPDGKLLLERDSDFCRRHNAQRVDLNRNSAWEWGGEGSSPAPGHEEYRGTAPFSEPESAFLASVASSSAYAAFVSVHSGERQFFSPFVDSRSRSLRRLPPLSPQAQADVDAVGRRIFSASSPAYFRDWGAGWQFNSYSADGTLYDWVAGSQRVKYTWCLEMWGGLLETGREGGEDGDCFSQFNPPPARLAADLAAARVFYVQLMLGVIERERGVRFQPVDWSSRGQEERSSMTRLCRAEAQLHRLRHAITV